VPDITLVGADVRPVTPDILAVGLNVGPVTIDVRLVVGTIALRSIVAAKILTVRTDIGRVPADIGTIRIHVRAVTADVAVVICTLLGAVRTLDVTAIGVLRTPVLHRSRLPRALRIRGVLLIVLARRGSGLVTVRVRVR